MLYHIRWHVYNSFFARYHFAQQVAYIKCFTRAGLAMKKYEAFGAGNYSLYKIIVKLSKALAVVNVEVFNNKVVVNGIFWRQR